jgi:hypothetical protein
MVFIRCGSALGHVLVGWTPMAPGPLGMYAFSIPGGDTHGKTSELAQTTGVLFEDHHQVSFGVVFFLLS